MLKIEADHATYGEECVTGVGKTLRDGAGIAGSATLAGGALEMVICNVVIVDPVLGVMKADIGINGGRIAAIGKAGNPAIMAGVTPGMTVGPGTKHMNGQG